MQGSLHNSYSSQQQQSMKASVGPLQLHQSQVNSRTSKGIVFSKTVFPAKIPFLSFRLQQYSAWTTLPPAPGKFCFSPGAFTYQLCDSGKNILSELQCLSVKSARLWESECSYQADNSITEVNNKSYKQLWSVHIHKM